MEKTTPMTEVSPTLSVPSHTFPLHSFSGVKKYKSVWRAMRRGLVSRSGEALPLRPFNNRKRTLGRKLQADLQDTSNYLKTLRKRNEEYKRKSA